MNPRRLKLALRLSLIGGPLLITIVLLASCSHNDKPSTKDTSLDPPPAPREFRAAWVASVQNIDWPSKPGLSVAQQQQELLAICDKAQALNLNALIVQVRPSCDALYPSSLEPWSEYLTGQQGKPPEPFYDPLKMWIDEAHQRGIELHVWLNPYRARHAEAKTPNAPTHIANTHPDVVKAFNKWQWLDPGDQYAQFHTAQVVTDLVRRYDIDGVHIDDYFYPYQSYLGKGVDFPDEPSWQRYVQSGGKLSRADWRRDNVNRMVQGIYTAIKQEKKHVKFGISPFGIWQPGYPSGIKGMNQYEELYADAKLWLNNGWCDYFTPQLYWALDAPDQPYRKLLTWWAEQNTQHRHLWPGNGAHQIDSPPKRWTADEILSQISATRETPGVGGNVLFSTKVLTADRGGLATALTQGRYAGQALVPASPWLDDHPPPAPIVTLTTSAEGLRISWRPGDYESPWLWTIYERRAGNHWRCRIVPGQQNGLVLQEDPIGGLIEVVAVAAVDRCGNESRRTVVRRLPGAN